MSNQWRNERFTQRGSGLGEFMSDTMRNRPEALLLMAAGAALLMTRGRGFGLSDIVSGAREATHFDEGMHAVADTAAQTASSVRERVGTQVEELRDTVGEYAERTAHQVQEGSEALMDTAGETIDRARSSLQENFNYMLREQPLMLGALSLAAGVAIGAALPRTIFEKDAMRLARQPLRQDRRERFRSAVGEAAQTARENLAGRSSEAGEARETQTKTPSQSS